MKRQSLVGHILQLYDAIQSGRQAPDNAVKEFFRSRHYLGGRDRRFISEAIYGMIRYHRLLKAYLDAAAATLSASNLQEFRTSLTLYCAYALRIAREEPGQVMSDVADLAQSLHPGLNPSSFLDALSGTAFPADMEVTPARRMAVRHSFPDFVVMEWVRRFGERRAEELCSSLNLPAPITIRVNTLKTTVDACQEMLKREGIESTRTTLSPGGLLLGKRVNVQALESFRRGWFEVQDEASQLIALLADPQQGESVVDACAGGGGKMLHMAALMNNAGILLAFDVDAGRLRRVQEREARAGVTIGRLCFPQESEATLRAWDGRADRVLIDAPCTGLGTVRRNPWLKSNVSEEDVDRISEVQHSVLDRFARLVKLGGRLVYATCTLLEKENEGSVGWFLSTHAQFSLLSAPELIRARGVGLTSTSSYLELLPSETGTDGFFAAALVRNA